MNAGPERGLWCQDLCPCVAVENASVAPPQGFHSRRLVRRQLSDGDSAGAALDTDAEDLSPYEAAVAFDGESENATARAEPKAYQRWRAARDAARAAAAAGRGAQEN